jgi:SpoIIAA-like
VVERLEGMPEGTLGFRASGRIEPSDYRDVLAPALHEALEGGGGLRTLYVIEDLEEVEPSALWADTKLGAELIRHPHEWKRSAIVTDIGWMAHATRLFAWMLPGEARVFPASELEGAKAWVAG